MEFILHIPQCSESPLVIRMTVLVVDLIKSSIKVLRRGGSFSVNLSSRSKHVFCLLLFGIDRKQIIKKPAKPEIAQGFAGDNLYRELF